MQAHSCTQENYGNCANKSPRNFQFGTYVKNLYWKCTKRNSARCTTFILQTKQLFPSFPLFVSYFERLVRVKDQKWSFVFADDGLVQKISTNYFKRHHKFSKIVMILVVLKSDCNLTFNFSRLAVNATETIGAILRKVAVVVFFVPANPKYMIKIMR